MVVSGLNKKEGQTGFSYRHIIIAPFYSGFLAHEHICRLPKSVGELSREGGKTGSLTVNDLDGSMFSKQRADLRLNDCCQGLSPKVSLTSF